MTLLRCQINARGRQHIAFNMPFFHNGAVGAVIEQLLHGEEEFVSGDAGYQGAQKREELKETNMEWLIAERLGKVRALFSVKNLGW